jgi:hypothetical protein
MRSGSARQGDLCTTATWKQLIEGPLLSTTIAVPFLLRALPCQTRHENFVCSFRAYCLSHTGALDPDATHDVRPHRSATTQQAHPCCKQIRDLELFATEHILHCCAVFLGQHTLEQLGSTVGLATAALITVALPERHLQRWHQSDRH